MSRKTSIQWPTRTSLAAAIALSLGGCSSTPDMGGYDTGAVGETLGRIGHATADASVAAWEGAQRFFGIGIGAVPRQPAGTESQGGFAGGALASDELLDEVDLALMDAQLTDAEGNAVAIAQPTRTQPASIMQPLPASPGLSADPMATMPTNTPALANASAPLDNGLPGEGEIMPAMEIDAPQDRALPGDVFVASQDYTHEVQASENLWQIAKQTTGDANNWHVLADINNLAPDASVFPGQSLLIPADLVKPELVMQAAAETAPMPAAESALANAGETPAAAGRLAIPGRSDAATLAQSDVSAVAAPAADDALPSVDMQAPRRAFELEANETLWDFAKRTTGDATNWKAIAAFNSFTEKQATLVRMGQSIDVPGDLVRAELADGAVDEDIAASAIADTPAPAAATDSADEPALAAAAPAGRDAAIDASSMLLNESATASLLDETQPVKIVEANFQSAPAVNAEQIAAEAKAVLTEQQTIMVSGTYYPKAIYNEADFSSSLLMRVSPGTELTVSRAIGPWFEVTTDKGVGYVHSRDIK